MRLCVMTHMSNAPGKATMSRGSSDETLDIVKAIQGLVSSENPTTVRFLLYKLISTGVLQSTKQYAKLVTIVRDARVRGELEDDCFVDNKRVVHDRSSWKNLEDYKDTIKHAYSRDRWVDQNDRVIILVEKGTVGDVLHSTCRGLYSPLYVSTGYYSRPFLV